MTHSKTILGLRLSRLRAGPSALIVATLMMGGILAFQQGSVCQWLLAAGFTFDSCKTATPNQTDTMLTSYSAMLNQDGCQSSNKFACLGPDLREQCEAIDRFARDFIRVATVAHNLRDYRGRKIDGTTEFGKYPPHAIKNGVVDHEDIMDGSLYFHEGSHPALYPDDSKDQVELWKERCFPGEN